MLKSTKIRPMVQTLRHLGRNSVDLGREGLLLVDSPAGRLILVPKHINAGTPVAPRLVIISRGGKLSTLARKGTFGRERFATMLAKISDQLKADIQMGDIDVTTREFTTVFKEA